MAKTRAIQTIYNTQEKDEALLVVSRNEFPRLVRPLLSEVTHFWTPRVIYLQVLSYSAIGILLGNTSSRAQMIP